MSGWEEFEAASGVPATLTHQCRRCSQETVHYYLCDDCIELTVKQMIGEGVALNRHEAITILYEREEDCWLASQRG